MTMDNFNHTIMSGYNNIQIAKDTNVLYIFMQNSSAYLLLGYSPVLLAMLTWLTYS